MRIAYLFLLLATCVYASELTSQTNSLYESAKQSAEIRRTLIAEYESSANETNVHRILAVAVSYAVEGKYESAIPLYRRLLSAAPNNTRALLGMGNCYFKLQRSPEETAKFYERALELGDERSLGPLAACYLAMRQYDRMDKLVPSLLQRMTNERDLAACLMAYALAKEPADGSLFVQAMDSIPDAHFLDRDDVARLFMKAIPKFDGPGDYSTGTVILTNETSRAICQKVVRGYEAAPAKWPELRGLAPAESYRLLGEFKKAEPVYVGYLATHPEDTYGRTQLGFVQYAMENYRDAVRNLRIAWSQGATNVLVPLANAHVFANDLDGLTDLIPQMLARKRESMALLLVFAAYSTDKKPENKQLFLQAMEGVTDEQILQEVSAPFIIGHTLIVFGEKERGERLVKARIASLRKDWGKGDTNAMLDLALGCAYSGPADEMDDLVPLLMKMKSENLQAVIALVGYSINKRPPYKGLFFKAIGGLTDEELVKKEKLYRSVVEGLKLFKDEERLQRLVELHDKREAKAPAKGLAPAHPAK